LSFTCDLDQRKLLAASHDEAAIVAEKLFKAGSTNYLTVLDANLALILQISRLPCSTAKSSTIRSRSFWRWAAVWKCPHCCRISRS
jgi:hypothetical protein